MSDAVWYVFEAGEQTGPFAESDLRAFMMQGRLTVAALIWRDGMPDWMAITILIPPQPRQNYDSGIRPTPSRSTYRRKRGMLARYKHYIGVRSFIFQTILVGWTALIGAWMASVSVSSVKSFEKHQRHASSAEDLEAANTGAALGMGAGWCCLGGAWAIIALPCGIAAIATMEKNP